MNKTKTQITTILTLSDVKNTVKNYFEGLKKIGISKEKLQKEREEHISNSTLDEAQTRAQLLAIQGVYSGHENKAIIALLKRYIALQISQNQIKIDKIFEWVSNLFEELESVHKDLTFLNEEKFTIYVETMGILGGELESFSTAAFDKKEAKLRADLKDKMAKKGDDILKHNIEHHKAITKEQQGKK